MGVACDSQFVQTELLFISNQQQVIVSRLSSLADRLEAEGMKNSAKRVRQWVDDASFLARELGSP